MTLRYTFCLTALVLMGGYVVGHLLDMWLATAFTRLLP